MSFAVDLLRRHANRLPAPDSVAGIVIPVLRAGILAEEFCRRARLAEVAAAFDRCIYLRTGERFVCIGEPAIGNGPLTLIVDPSEYRCWRDLRLHAGQTAGISEGSIVIGDAIRFSVGRCEPWRAPPWPQRRSSVVLSDVRDGIARLVQSEAPADGLGRLICPRGQDAFETPLARIARPRVVRFADWLRAAREAPHVSRDASPVFDLIGLGPGLTPSGDDFLSGALATLAALAERGAHAALARAIAAAPCGLTSPLSHCFLRAAAAGHVGESLCRAAASAVDGSPAAAVAAIRQVGHSSGWDMLAGIATALAVVAGCKA
jgi:hypothetical protein